MPKGIPTPGRRNVPPHSRQLQRGYDPRRSHASQVNAASVTAQAQFRALCVQVLHEPFDATQGAPASKLEEIVRG